MSSTTHQPHSTEAEQALLGALLIEPESTHAIEVLGTVRASEFFDPAHREIFVAIRTLYEARKPIDLVTLSTALSDSKRINATGGSAYLAELTTVVPTAANAPGYAEIIRNKALHRAVAGAGVAITKFGSDESLSGMEVLERAEQQILAISRQSTGSKPEHLMEIGAQGYERYARAQSGGALPGLHTGFGGLDTKLDALEPGALLVIAARPSMGKTALALSIAEHVAAKQQKTVAMFSLEMTKQQLLDRIVAGRLGVQAWKLKKGKLSDDEFEKLGKLFDDLKEHPLYIDDDPDTSIANLRSKARRQQMEHGLDLLIIDYLQLIDVTDPRAGENRTQQVTHISRSLKNLARELECPVIALSQLSRSVEQRSPAIPILSDLRESGSIEQDADIVLMLYREQAYNEDCEHPGVTDVYVRKNRNGPTGRVELFFNAEHMTFTSVDHHHPASAAKLE